MNKLFDMYIVCIMHMFLRLKYLLSYPFFYFLCFESTIILVINNNELKYCGLEFLICYCYILDIYRVNYCNCFKFYFNFYKKNI